MSFRVLSVSDEGRGWTLPMEDISSKTASVLRVLKRGNSPHISKTDDLHWTKPCPSPEEPEPAGSAASQQTSLGKTRQGCDSQLQHI